MCSLTTPEGYSSGIDQPPNSANFAPSATCRSCSGRRRRSGRRGRLLAPWREPTAADGAAARADAAAGYPAPVTSYTPAQRQPRQDPRRRRRRRRASRTARARSCAPAARTSPTAYGRKLRPLLATLGVTGKAGEVAQGADRRAPSPRRCWCWSGSARPATRRRDAPYAGPPASRPAPSPTPPSVALALPAGRPRAGPRRRPRATLLGGYTFTAYKQADSKDRHAPPATVVVLSRDRPARQEAVAAFEDAQVVARGRRRPPATGSTPRPTT